MEILRINSVDFSSSVNQRSWQVQNQKEYASWIDGNRITRRTLTRQKVTGTFTLTFKTGAALDAFKAAVAAATTEDDYTEVTVYVANDHQTKTINAFLTIQVKTVWTQDSDRTPAVFLATVKLEER